MRSRLPRCLYLLLMLPATMVVANFLSATEDPGSTDSAKSILPLYRDLRTVRLETGKVYRVREAVMDRDDLHIFLNDGIVVFTQEVEGHVTGMYFEGEGELLVRPPNRTEKESLGLFTKLGVLEDKFTHAYFRFNDDVFDEMKPFLRPPGEMDLSRLTQIDSAAGRLADLDALRLLSSFTSGPATDEQGRALIPDRFLHVRLGGSVFGTYDLFYDTANPEQISIAQLGKNKGLSYYDFWMSFAARTIRNHKERGIVPLRASESLHVDKFKIDSVIHPPNDLSGEADLDISVRQGGPRILFFELSHTLKVKKVMMGQQPLEWLQNEAIEGTQLARRGNDFIAVALPEPCKAGDRLTLHFSYEGSVLAEAGNGLLYVGAHGIWYPNRGLTPSQYELNFKYPQPWTLVAIGKRTAESQNGDMRSSTWVSERPVPVAGFNLGQYVEAREKVGEVDVAAYATHSVEKDFPASQTYTVSSRRDSWSGPSLSEIVVPLNINPSATTKVIAHDAAQTVDYYNHLWGPYPFSGLRLTQFPGPESQGWPSLIYLSSYTFLTPEQREKLGMSEFVKVFFGTLMLRHEIAHEWWGHEVFWDSYRDQWLTEALANYSALMMTERTEPEKFHIIMEGYRNQLMSKHDGRHLYEAGPVTLGLRLNSAKFPDGYQAIAYGRGTWLIHMLRCMLEDGTRTSKIKSKSSGDELFVQALRTVLQRHRDTGMSTDDLRRAFEEVWPETLRFEGRKSLDWFFDGWVNGDSMPALELSGTKITKQGTGDLVTGIVRQKDAPDDLVTSVPVYSQLGEKYEYLGRVFAVGSETRFRLHTPASARKIVLDPFHTVLTRP